MEQRHEFETRQVRARPKSGGVEVAGSLDGGFVRQGPEQLVLLGLPFIGAQGPGLERGRSGNAEILALGSDTARAAAQTTANLTVRSGAQLALLVRCPIFAQGIGFAQPLADASD